MFWNLVIPDGSTTMAGEVMEPGTVLEPCHSRWFYYYLLGRSDIPWVLEPCHSRWFYYRRA